jgi:hypothetical protein
MEKKIALVRKSDQRVDNVFVVDSLEKSHIAAWETDALDVVAVKDSIPYVHGLWDGEEFHAPENEYLISIGLLVDRVVEEIVEE